MTFKPSSIVLYFPFYFICPSIEPNLFLLQLVLLLAFLIKQHFRFFYLPCNLAVRSAAEGIAVLYAGFGTDGVFYVRFEEVGQGAEFFHGHVFEPLALLDAEMHGASCDGVCFSERHAFLHEVVGKVGGVGEVFRDGAFHDVAFDRHAAQECCVDGEAEFHRVDGVEHAFLVLLQILVVGKRQTLDDREHRHEVSDDASRLAAHKLGDVGILLLRHHGGACAVGIVQLDEGEFARAPEDDFLGEPREMHHEDGGGGEEFHDVVAITDGIEAVRVDGVEVKLLRHELTVDGERRSRKRTRAERHDVRTLIDAQKARKVACEHGEVGEHMVREEDRLRTLQVRIARHDHVGIALRRLDKRTLQIGNAAEHGERLAAHIEVRVERDLIVAATRRVQPAARLADRVGQTLLDVHVDVFERDRKVEVAALDVLQNVAQPRDDGIFIRFRDDAALGEHFRVRDAARDVFAVHTLVEGNRCLEIVDHLVRALGETTAPKLFAHFFPAFSCMRARTFKGRPKRLMKPVASDWS